jgi:hypothetical protein
MRHHRTDAGRRRGGFGALGAVALTGVALAVSSACSSNSSNDLPAASTCASPGSVPPGAPTTRCALADGGLMVQPVNAASCSVAGDGGAGVACAYGDTLFGQEGPDDDCKYFVSWTATPLCEGKPGVVFSAKVTFLGTTTPLTGAGTRMEYFLDSPGDGGSCGGTTTHLGPTLDPNGGFLEMKETSPGTYVGQLQFDAAGPWTLRFHFNEDCLDVLDDSPHGHAAFHLILP